MQHSDVVINFGSTITLDAAFFDTPVICPFFNLSLPTNAWNNARAVHLESNHFSRVIDSGAVSTPNDWRELRDAIREAIESPTIRSLERRRLIEDMIPDLPTSTLIRESIDKAVRGNSRPLDTR